MSLNIYTPPYTCPPVINILKYFSGLHIFWIICTLPPPATKNTQIFCRLNSLFFCDICDIYDFSNILIRFQVEILNVTDISTFLMTSYISAEIKNAIGKKIQEPFQVFYKCHKWRTHFSTWFEMSQMWNFGIPDLTTNVIYVIYQRFQKKDCVWKVICICWRPLMAWYLALKDPTLSVFQCERLI